MHVFTFFPWQKLKMSTKSTKVFNYVILYMYSIKIFQFPLFYHFLFWLKSKMAAKVAAVLENVTGPQQRHNP